MGKTEFLDALKRALPGLPPATQAKTLAFYEQRFVDGAAQGRSEQDVARELDDPSRIAMTLRASAFEAKLAPPARHPAGMVRMLLSAIGLGVFNLFMVAPAAVVGALLLCVYIGALSCYISGIAITASGLAGANELVLRAPLRAFGVADTNRTRVEISERGIEVSQEKAPPDDDAAPGDGDGQPGDPRTTPRVVQGAEAVAGRGLHHAGRHRPGHGAERDWTVPPWNRSQPLHGGGRETLPADEPLPAEGALMRSLLKIGVGLLILALVLIGLSYSMLRADGVQAGARLDRRAVASETRVLASGIEAVELSGPIDLTLRYGPRPSLTVKGEERTLANIDTWQTGNLLHIGTKGMLLHHREPLQAVLVLPTVARVALDGSGDSVITGLSGDAIVLELTGSGSVKFNGRYQTVSVSVHGSGDLELNAGNSDAISLEQQSSGQVTAAGSVRQLTVRKEGSGELDAQHLRRRGDRQANRLGRHRGPGAGGDHRRDERQRRRARTRRPPRAKRGTDRQRRSDLPRLTARTPDDSNTTPPFGLAAACRILFFRCPLL
jgi:uncharacterized membrane protein